MAEELDDNFDAELRAPADDKAKGGKPAEAADDLEIIISDDPKELAGGGKVAAASDEEEDDDREETLSEEDNEEGPAIDPNREQRRNDRRQKRLKKNKRYSEMKAKFESMEKIVAGIQHGFTQMTEQQTRQAFANIDSGIAAAKQRFDKAQADMVEAVNASNGEAIAKALNDRDVARDDFNRLGALKRQATAQVEQHKREQQNGGQRQEAEEADTISEAGLKRVDRFAKKYPWYDPTGENPDSVVVKNLDRRVANEGYDMEVDAYWDRLDELMKKNLPHRFGKNAKEAGRRGPMTGGGGGRAPGQKERVVIPTELEDGLRQAGIWDDLPRRNRAIRDYQNRVKAEAS